MRCKAYVKARLEAVATRLPPGLQAWLFERHSHLWHINRRMVARGIAAGLLWGFIIPLGQIPAAVAMASWWRGNVLAAAVATFITNPFTTPFVYLASYQIGRSTLTALFGHGGSTPPAEMDHWWLFIALGTTVIGIVAAIAGYHLTHWWWRRMVLRRRREGRAAAVAA